MKVFSDILLLSAGGQFILVQNESKKVEQINKWHLENVGALIVHLEKL